MCTRVSHLALQVSHLYCVALRSDVCGKSWWNHVFSSRHSCWGHIPSCWLERERVCVCVCVCGNRLLWVVPNSSLLPAHWSKQHKGKVVSVRWHVLFMRVVKVYAFCYYSLRLSVLCWSCPLSRIPDTRGDPLPNKTTDHHRPTSKNTSKLFCSTATMTMCNSL